MVYVDLVPTASATWPPASLAVIVHPRGLSIAPYFALMSVADQCGGDGQYNLPPADPAFCPLQLRQQLDKQREHFTQLKRSAATIKKFMWSLGRSVSGITLLSSHGTLPLHLTDQRGQHRRLFQSCPRVSSISRVHLSGVGVSGGCFVEAGERVLYFAASALCEVGKEAMTVFGI